MQRNNGLIQVIISALGRTPVWSADIHILRAYVEYFNRGDRPAAPLPAP